MKDIKWYLLKSIMSFIKVEEKHFTESLSNDCQQFHQYQQNKESLNSDGQ